MSFDRQKRLLLGCLTLLVPLPLPFNEVIGWPVLALYWLAVGVFLVRASSGAGEPLPSWAMNLLGLGYLPFLVFELSHLWQGRALRPLVHLAMFALVVKLYGLKREKEKWHIFLVVFFLFLAAMGSSVHPAVLIYLIAFLVLSFYVLARFASLHVLGSFGAASTGRVEIPLRGFLSWGTVATVLLAVPLFMLLPRLGQPYFVAPVTGVGGLSQSAGFSNQIGLDGIGRLRTSRAVVMRFLYENPPPEGHEMRFKGATFVEFRGRSWYRGRPESVQLRRRRGGSFHVAPGVPRSWMTLWLQPLGSDRLVLPVEARTVDVQAIVLSLDQTGVVSTLLPSHGTLSYRVGLAEGVPQTSALPGADEVAEVELDQGGVTSRIARLAEEVAGTGTPAEQAARIEAHLSREYEYTLDLVGFDSAQPLEDFLFKNRRAQCEYFASSMVVMLRSLEIPARLVTGFLGGEYNPFEEYFIVRQSHAHAWVEAYLPDEGWRIYDPTPPAGRPGSQTFGLGSLLGQAYDYLLFRWERHVLTYGLYDQVGLAQRMHLLWTEYWRGLWREGARSKGEEPQRKESSRPAPISPRDLFGPSLLPLLLALLAAAWWIWRHRPALSAARAYRHLRARLQRDPAIRLADSVPPIQLGKRLEERYPAASGAAWRVIELYLLESFGGQELGEEERTELRRVLREAQTRLRRSA